MDLLDTQGSPQTGTLNGTIYGIFETRIAPKRQFHFEIDAGTCTFQLQGRVDEHCTWVVVASASANYAAEVAAWPQMRLILTAATGAEIHGALDADGRAV